MQVTRIPPSSRPNIERALGLSIGLIAILLALLFAVMFTDSKVGPVQLGPNTVLRIQAISCSALIGLRGALQRRFGRLDTFRGQDLG